LSSRDLDGVDDQISWGDLNVFDGASALSILLWMNPDALISGQTFFGKVNILDAIGWYLQANTTSPFSGIFVGITTSDFGEVGSGMLVTRQWDFHAMVYDGTLTGNANRLKYFRNGSQQTLTFVGTIPATTQTSAYSVRAGTTEDSFNFADAKLAQVLMYSRALSVDEVGQCMRFPGSIKRGLEVHAPLSFAATEPDYSGNARSGTVTGATIAAESPPVSGMSVIPHPGGG
jgi:hypothetical protein